MKFGLIKGRHELPVKNYIFENDIEDVKNLEDMYNIVYDKIIREKEITVYVTGLTVALTTVIKVCSDCNINLKLMHYDREVNEYYEQIIFDNMLCSYCKTYSIKNSVCGICGSN